MHAKNNPVIVKRGREVYTGDMSVSQKESANLDDLGSADARIEQSTIIAPAVDNDAEFHAQLAYNEQPVTIRIERSSDKGVKHADCYVNGRGAELLIEGKWLSVGYMPCGVVITTKRKYVEVLMRSRPDDLNTEIIEVPNQNPLNRITYTTRQKYPVSIIEDRHPIDPSGHAWAERIMSEQ